MKVVVALAEEVKAVEEKEVVQSIPKDAKPHCLFPPRSQEIFHQVLCLENSTFEKCK